MSDDQLARARALLQEAADAIVVVVGQVPGKRADANTAAALDTRDRIRAFLAGQGEPARSRGEVHLLHHGAAACGVGAPTAWPEGDRWTDRALVATCQPCRRWAREHDYHRERG